MCLNSKNIFPHFLCSLTSFALTPVFGHDFPDVCLKPTDEGFGEMVIDPEITRYCARQAREFRDEDAATTRRSPASSSWSLVPDTPSPCLRKVATKTVKKLGPAFVSPYNSPFTKRVPI